MNAGDRRVALVTGGGSGIGEAIARRLARDGFLVCVVGRRPELIRAVAASIGGRAFQADVTVESEVETVMQDCRNAGGRLDLLVNSAGTGGSRSLLREMDIAEWDRTIATNLRSVVLCIKHAIPLLETVRGRIVNIGSRDGLSGTRASRSDYVASKFAVTGLTEALAQEIGPAGICVNDVCPGAVRTDLFMESAAREARKSGTDVETFIRTRFADVAALKRMVSPDDVANTVSFLASEGASGITGIHLKVDCGRPV